MRSRTDLAKTLDLGPVDQISYAVENLEHALPHYEALFGRFRVSEASLKDVTYRGKQIDCRLRLAITQSGPIEIELIEVLEGETPHSEHVRTHGEGLHHVRFRAEHLDPKLEALAAAGFETIFYKRFGPTVAFAYVEAPTELGRSVIELLEMPGM